jgi:large subunit ribosomal protein L17
MRHLNQGRKLNRTSAHRKALFRNLVLSLVRYERIKTTDAKAKELRRYADRMVTLGKRGDLAARRLAYNFMQSREAVKKLFDEIAPRFKDRAGGYTRVVKFGMRRGDAAPISII